MTNQPLKFPDGLDEANMHAINYSFVENTATLIYKPATSFDIHAVTEYVDDMTDKRAVRIVVWRGATRTHDLFRMTTGAWGGISEDEG